MKKKEQFNIWKSQSDMLTGLVLILLLIISLLGLIIAYQEKNELEHEYDHIEDDYHGEDQRGDSYNDPDDGRDEKYDRRDDIGGGSGTYEEYHEYDNPTSGGGGVGPGMFPDEGVKSAVYVVMIDEETERTIKEAGVEFELYKEDNSLQILNTYYPVKISYQKYQTTEEGVFYLPEKIWQGKYWMHELTAPAGYDPAPNQEFFVDKLYDWPEPYVVKMPLSPSKNIIRIQMKDRNTGTAVQGSTFRIIAAEDIYTQDETLRYKEGEVVDTITCDENGYAESKELFLGNYIAQQVTIPEYYVSIPENITAKVEKKTDVLPEVHETDTEKTEVTFRLCDELYPDRGIEGATFSVTSDKTGVKRTITTDVTGTAVLSDMEKNATYHIVQETSTDHYIPVPEDYSFTVASDGRIEGEGKQTVQMQNRMIRASFDIKEKFTGEPITDTRLGLFASDGTLIEAWTASGRSKEMTGLAEGSYYITVNNDDNHRYPVEIKNVKEIQKTEIEKLTTKSIVLAVLAGAAGVIILTGLFIGFRKIKNNNRD